MATEVVQLNEYELVELPDGYTYVLVTSTLQPSERAAHDWVTERIRAEGIGEGAYVAAGHLPGRVWGTTSIKSVETEISAGSDLDGSDGLFDIPEVNGDKPLPPDES